MQADVSLLKWGQPKYRELLKNRFGVDYQQTPAEDFCTSTITYQNSETGQFVKAQFTDSWMYDKQGLRHLHGDEAAQAVFDSASALEKSTVSRGLLAAQPNEADLYGYVGELKDMRDAFLSGKNAALDWNYSMKITRLYQACYLSAEKGKTIDLTDELIQKKLNNYQSLIAKGEGTNVLFG